MPHMNKPDRIPLFPLDVVLLPDMLLPLHIFEPRYKTMVQYCLGNQLEFGIVLATNQTVARVGCMAEITLKIKEYPDGRMDILTGGRSAFRLTDVLEEKEYHEGIIEYIDEDRTAQDPGKEARLIEVFEQCHVLLFGRAWGDQDRERSATLAFRMTARLPTDLEQRQALLEMRTENERRDFLLGWLAKFLPKLADRQQARRRAGGNGHALN
jgi:ATP-dependent Lon protease